MSLPAAGTDIRVLVTRRPEQKVSNELGGVITIEINKPSNYADILAYVSDSLQNNEKFGHLRAGPTIADEADKMFRCRRLSTATFVTSLAIDHDADAKGIRKPRDVEDCPNKPQKLIRGLPDGMNSLYE